MGDNLTTLERGFNPFAPCGSYQRPGAEEEVTLMTHHLMTSVLLGATTVTGAVTGGAIEAHDVSVSTVCAVAGIVVPATWWLSAKLKATDDKLEQLGQVISKLQCMVDNCKLPKKKEQ